MTERAKQHDSQFRSLCPELLLELASHTASTIQDVIEIDAVIAEQIGDAVANHIMRLYGGQNIYIPKGLQLLVNLRDQAIFRAFNGRNHHELAREFGISLQWVYSIVKRFRELERMNRQSELDFGAEQE